MAQITELDRKRVSDQTQKIISKLRKTSGTEDRAKAGVALAILALVAAQTDDSKAQTLLKTLQNLNLY